jgi:hypothetical protein
VKGVKMIVDKKEYIKIKNEKPNKEFLNECKEISKIFNKCNNMTKLKDYIIEKKNQNVGDIVEYVYEDILNKIYELEGDE